MSKRNNGIDIVPYALEQCFKFYNSNIDDFYNNFICSGDLSRFLYQKHHILIRFERDIRTIRIYIKPVFPGRQSSRIQMSPITKKVIFTSSGCVEWEIGICQNELGPRYDMKTKQYVHIMGQLPSKI